MRLALAALLIAGTVAPAAETWLVAVGVEAYDDQAVPGLRFAVADARALDEAFGAAGVLADHRRLLTSDAAERPALATRSNILAALEFAAARTSDGDTLVFLFAGHGMETAGEAFLLPVDARRNLLADTALPMRLVNAALRSFRGANVLFLIDACRNEPDAARSDADAALDERFARNLRPTLRVDAGREPTVALLLACEVGQRAWEMPETGHGVFTNFVLRGLQGGAAEPDGTVRLSRLSRYVQAEVSAWAERQQKQQTPRFDNPSGQDFELPSAAAAIVRPNLRNQPPVLSVEGHVAGQERLLAAGETAAVIVGTVTDDGGEPTLTAGGNPVRLVPAGPGRWTFSVRVPLEPGQAGEVPLEVTDAGGLTAARTVALRRPRPDPPPADPPTPPTGPNERPVDWPDYLREFEPPAGMSWSNFRVSPKDNMPQVLIPAGEFLMGSPATEPARDDEGPQKRVYVSAFWMDVHEVTVEQYCAFLRAAKPEAQQRQGWCNLRGEDDAKPDGWTGPWVSAQILQRGDDYRPAPGTEQQSVAWVSWHGAVAYAQWAGRQLPTEAQWEKAARGGTTTAYPWGDRWDAARAVGGWVALESVGSKPANGFGLHDMIGGVWEWCRDAYDERWYTRMPARDPINQDNGTFRVLRGGSWRSIPETLRVAYRNWYNPGNRYSSSGFRCAEAP